MADNYEGYETENGGSGFMMGLLAGTVIGAGLGLLLAPKAGAEIRGQIGKQARHIGSKASEQYRRASGMATDWAEKGREAVTHARDTVMRNAEEARGYASGTPGSGSFGGSTSGTDFGRS